MRNIDIDAVTPDQTASPVALAILALSQQCDGARATDGVGFSRYDAEFGYSLASSIRKYKGLTPKQHAAAQRLCGKYAKQLIDLGFNLNEVLTEPPPEGREKPAPVMVRFLAQVQKETDKAVQVLINGQAHWMPKSQAVVEGEEIVLPKWLAAKKGL